MSVNIDEPSSSERILPCAQALFLHIIIWYNITLFNPPYAPR